MATNGSDVDLGALLERGIGMLKWGYLLLGLLGLLSNLPVVYISLKPGLVERDFKWFILNLSFVDTFASLMFIGNSGAYFLMADYPGALCSIQGFIFYYNAFSVFWVLFPVTVNRFVNIFLPHRSGMFTPGSIACMCLLIDALPALQVASYGLFGHFGQSPVTGSCTLIMRKVFDFETFAKLYAFNNALNWAVFAVTFVLNAALHFKIRKHLSVVSTIDDKQRLRETRDLVRATLLQVLAPAVLLMPPTVVDTYSEVAITDVDERRIFQLVYLIPLILLLAMNPTTDALLTLGMLKPYRKAVTGFWQRMHGQSRTAAAQFRTQGGGTAGSAPRIINASHLQQTV